MVDLPRPFACAVSHVTDGDTLRCSDDRRIRIAGVQAPDRMRSAPCRQRRPGYVCDDAAAARSKRIVERMTLGQVLTCQPLGRSYARIVARCRFEGGRDLSCTVIATGAAVRWDYWWNRYRMGRCG